MTSVFAIFAFKAHFCICLLRSSRLLENEKETFQCQNSSVKASIFSDERKCVEGSSKPLGKQLIYSQK